MPEITPHPRWITPAIALLLAAGAGLTWPFLASCSGGGEAEKKIAPGRAIPGFTWRGLNAQGYHEYTHAQTQLVFVLLPGGTFEMGGSAAEHEVVLATAKDDEEEESWRDSLDAELPRHAVTLDPFLIAKHEVTQAQWRAVTGESPSYLKHAGDDAPVEQVSWVDCREKFLAKTGLRFPTEAQWEYACRAGTTGPIYTGALEMQGRNHSADVDPIAWYAGNSGVSYEGSVSSSTWPEKQHDHARAGTHPVGRKQPNGFGLHDMLGNVYEWCEDVYDPAFYGKVAATNRNPSCAAFSEMRAIRGGSWDDFPGHCRSAFRNGAEAFASVYGLGLRPAFWPLPRE